jgi:predicted O-methyltransferase YrrM
MIIKWHQIKHFIWHFITAKRKGHGVHSPFAYQLCEEVFYNHNHFYAFEQLAKTRAQLLSDETLITVEDYGAGSHVLKDKQRKVKDIAAKGISTRKQSELMYRLVNFLNCKTCIELGSSLGLNTLYLAKVNANTKVISIEGSKELHRFAKKLASKHQIRNCEFIQAKFDEILPDVLEQLVKLDFFYIDGNHTYEATLNYFKLGLPKHTSHSVFVLDDIYWSPGMTKAWQEINQHPSVSLSIDLFYFGLVFFKEEVKEKLQLKMYL